MVKILKYNNLYHKIKLKIRQIQVLGKSTWQINITQAMNGTSVANRSITRCSGQSKRDLPHA